MSVRVLLCGGGTGGHIYPALQVSRSLSGVLTADHRAAAEPFPDAAEPPRFLYVGAQTELDRRIVVEAGLPFVGLAVGGVRGLAPLPALGHLAGHAAALPRALALVRSFRPHVVLVAGGYVCVPVALAAWLLRVPAVVMTVDIVPGWAISLACRLGSVVTAAFPEALAHLPRPLGGGPVVVAGYPLREEFVSRVSRAQARSALGIGLDDPLLAVFGGSQGARRINTALQEALPALLPHMRVVHIGGRRDAQVLDDCRRTLPAHLRERYRLVPYLQAAEMAQLLAAADLALCRSGAGAIAELTALGLPAVLVPGEFSHQDLNAHHMAAAGAAIVVADAALTAATLRDTVVGLIADRFRLAGMAERGRALARPGAALEVARIVARAAAAGPAGSSPRERSSAQANHR